MKKDERGQAAGHREVVHRSVPESVEGLATKAEGRGHTGGAEENAPAREGAEIQSVDGQKIGEVTSGGFGPSAGAPVAMGYVEAGFSKTGTQVNLIVRGKPLPAIVADMPFVPHRYYRG